MKTNLKRILCTTLVLVMVMALSTAFAEANTALTGTIRIIGPGALNGPGAEGAEDLVTGAFKPGYNALIEEFNKDYPNVVIQFTETPWDNWKAVLQTAAAGGTADILLHGSMLTDISLDLTPYLEKTPEIYDYMTTGPEQYRDPEDYTKTIPTGLSYCVDPYFCIIDTKIFEDYGVELPSADWTWEDMLALAEKLTGTDPITGEQTYGVYNFNLTENDAWKAFSSYCAAKGFINMHFDSANKWEATMTFNSEECIAALQYFYDLAKFSPANFVEGMGNENVGRATSDIAIRLTEGMMGAYSTTLVDDVADRFIYMPLPVNEDQTDAKYSSFTGTNSIAISKNAADPDLAWEFIKWLIMDDDAQQWLVDNLVCPSTHKAIDMMKEKGYPFMDAYEAIMGDFWDCYSISQTDVIDIAYGNLQSIFFGNICEMYADTMTPAECAQAIQDQTIELIEMNK